MRHRRGLAALYLTLLCTTPSSAQTPAPSLPAALRIGGYVESFWQWNFARPSNGITNFRAFDNRHNSFTLSNVALDVGWDDGHVVARIVGQVGHTPSTYYAAEPASPATSGANGSDAALWKYLQQANLGYRFALAGRPMLVDGGLFLSPIGPESMVVHDNATWSRSVLFYGLPFYHTGVRASYELSARWKLMLAAFNGWNSVVDNNGHKSLLIQGVYTPWPALALSMLYFGGVERTRGSAEGTPWRHLFDAHATWRPHAMVTLMAHANAGFEANHFGISRWSGGAFTARVAPWEMWAFALRGDVLDEHLASDTSGTAAPLFYPAGRVGSATATVDFHPDERISLRLEYRHDEASAPIYFRDRVPSGGTPDTRRGDTLSVGATAWF